MAPVGDEGGEGAAFDAVGEVVDCAADDVVAAANGEGLIQPISAEFFVCSIGIRMRIAGN